MGWDRSQWGRLSALFIGSSLALACTKDAQISCFDKQRCYVRAGACSKGYQGEPGDQCAKLGFSQRCGELWLKPPLSCNEEGAGSAPDDAGVDAAQQAVPAPCAGRKLNEPLSAPAALATAPCRFELAAACEGGPNGTIGTRTIIYPACVAIALDPLPEDCGARGEQCLVAMQQDAERCRPPELDAPAFNALLATACTEVAAHPDGLDAGSSRDAGTRDAAALLDAGPQPDACALFQMQKDSLGLSAEALAELEAALCSNQGDGGAP